MGHVKAEGGVKMNTKHTKYLYKKYPVLYQQHKLSMSETCMCWGFDCGDGWFNILDVLSRLLTLYLPDVQALQVKEKYGTLRFYTNHCSETGYALISFAEHLSGRTCETCGNPGKLYDTGWYSTACVKCKEEHNKKKEGT